MGINASNTNVTVTDLTVASREAIRVTVDTQLPTMLAGNFSSALPLSFRMSDSAVAIKNSNYAKYAQGILLSTGQMWTVPLVNETGNLPNDGKPAWGISLPLFWKVR